MDRKKLLQKTLEGFEDNYRHFKGFRENEEYRIFWDKCVETLQDSTLFGHIVFCNDVFHIPPVKTFFTYHSHFFSRYLREQGSTRGLEVKLRQYIGAFWGSVFQYALGYRAHVSVYVGMKEVGVLTGSYYYGKGDTLRKMIH